ncbi:MAG: hypothetical protein M1828_001182 [Chrysothrix sp. TS-e1954]|nr:MAG: hypothetical protein M1828_001182 [Chrysothrix sp. TS-e1954]
MAGTSTKSHASTPPSSPPSEGHEGQEIGKNESGEQKQHNGENGVSESMRAEEERMQQETQSKEDEREAQLAQNVAKDRKGVVDKNMKAFDYLINQSKLYSTIMLSMIQNQEQAADVKDEKVRKLKEKGETEQKKPVVTSDRRSTRGATSLNNEQASTQQESPSKPKRAVQSKSEKQGKVTDFVKKEELESRAGKDASIQGALQEEAAAVDDEAITAGDIGMQSLKAASQPSLVSGGVMRGYQLEGLEWLTSLYFNGLNGILADEMGLGKTLQTIALLAFIREKEKSGPFLIAAPLSTVSNWVQEFKRFAPSIPVVLYHGSKQERADMRDQYFKRPNSPEFPVICTSYEICMNDRKFLARFNWKYIIVDEGHRLKNHNSRFIRELQTFRSSSRLLITGTPLQNSLAELWSLLHFLMPTIFDKLENFESWFDFSALQQKDGHEEILSKETQNNLVTNLHAILKPFLLRRVKTDVEHTLPKKREYVLYAPMTDEQRELYQQILNGNSRAYLEDKVVETLSRNASGANTPNSAIASKKRKSILSSGGIDTPNKSAKTSRQSTPASTASRRGRKAKARQDYAELSDTAYFKQLEQGSSNQDSDEDLSEATIDHDRAATLAIAKKQIAQKKLQNPMMQLRLCCNSPHNFYDPFLDIDEHSDGPSSDMYKALVTASGKMQLLDVLLRSLLAKPANHKVLLFSQFKTQLDILSDYLSFCLPRDQKHCRIDGSIPAAERSEQITLFNDSKEHRVFLLSTRAGGQGINLAAADTVILFDSDWNPQQDLQAQDRAHRIGQKRNVIVYRLATKATVEEFLLFKAEGKRRLEKLVIKKGGLTKRSGNKGVKSSKGASEEEDSIEELRSLLTQTDGKRMELGEALLSQGDLDILTDRGEEAYKAAEQGSKSGVFQAVDTKKDGEGLLESLAS